MAGARAVAVGDLAAVHAACLDVGRLSEVARRSGLGPVMSAAAAWDALSTAVDKTMSPVDCVRLAGSVTISSAIIYEHHWAHSMGP